MSVSVFDDRSEEPTSAELNEALGETASLLQLIEQQLVEQFGDLTREWKFYGKKAGWTLALSHKGRRVLHLIPRPGLFTVVFTLGKRAVLAARESDLPDNIWSAIESAHDYAEGRSFRLEVATSADVAVVMQLAAIKMSNGRVHIRD